MKKLAYAFIYLFLNSFVSKIPCWFLRKMFYRLFGMKIGKKSRIYRKVVIVNPWRIRIGERTIINSYCYIDGRGGLTIGSDTSISIYCKIISATHEIDSSFSYKQNEVSIGNMVWLGASAIILDGSIVKDKTIIGAGAVFKGESLEDSIYLGVPAVFKKKRNLNNSYSLNTKDYLL